MSRTSPPSLSAIYVRRFIFRHWRQAWKESLVLLLLLAIGVGVYLSIRMANRAAVVSFQAFTETLTGESDLILRSRAGFLDTNTPEALRTAFGNRPVQITPVLEILVTTPRPPGDEGFFNRGSLQLVGLDLLALQNLAGMTDRSNRIVFATENLPEDEQPAGDLFSILGNPEAVFATRNWARAQGVGIGDPFQLLIDDRTVDFRLFGFLPNEPGFPTPPDTMLIMDLPALQEISGRKGQISRIEMNVEPGATAAETRRLLPEKIQALNPGTWILETPGERKQSGEVMTRAFRYNLTVLSLIALIVGLYLILQALDAAVVRRRQEIATLRSLGVSENDIKRAWLLEAAFLGLLGGILGIGIGWLAAQSSVQAIARTVNTLYQATTANAANLQLADIVIGLALGVGASLLAGWIPARDAARTPPAQILVRGHIDKGMRILNQPRMGLVLLLLGIVLYFFPALRLPGGTRFPLAGYGAAFLWMAGGSLLLPVFMRWLAKGAYAFEGVRRNPGLLLAVTRIREPSGRHKLAAAGLFIAVGMASGMAILIGSFEETMQKWIQRTLVADIYVASDANQSASSQARIQPDTWRKIIEDPRVEAYEALRGYPIVLDDLDTFVAGVDLPRVLASERLTWVKRPADPVSWIPESPPVPVLVSESFSQRFRRDVGATFEIPMQERLLQVRIAGIYADYGNERGNILMDQNWLLQGFPDRAVSSLALTLREGAEPEQVSLGLREAFPTLVFQTNRSLRTEVLRVFRQTFSITYALKAIGIAVAVGGLSLALIGLILENRADLTTLRAMGMGRPEIARLITWEGTGITIVGLLGGWILSYFLGRLLIYVINRQSFGWTLEFILPVPSLIGLGIAVLLTGAVVSYFIGRWSAGLPVDREE